MQAPSVPDPSTAAIQGAHQSLYNFPFQYQINALAQEGGSGYVNGKYYDFTGLGNADLAATMSDKMAQTLLDIQKNHGADYIKQRLADLQQADPQGYAARKQLFDKIIAAANANPDRPLASDLQDQVNSMLKNAGQLDERGVQQVQNQVRGGQVARGIYLGNAPIEQEAEAVVGASDQLRQQQQNTALNYLKSGISPEDVQYRRIQQSLADLGAFQQGTTPQTQFQQISGAQQGAAPFNPVNYQTPATVPTNGAQIGLNSAASNYNLQSQFQMGQSNPYLAGMGLFTNILGAMGNMNGGTQQPLSTLL